jgi:hypothetical protein
LFFHTGEGFEKGTREEAVIGCRWMRGVMMKASEKVDFQYFLSHRAG